MSSSSISKSISDSNPTKPLTLTQASLPGRPQRRSSRVAIDGLLLLDKPSGMGSNQALQKIKYIFNALKAGHVGTLDPLASGLLPICFGEATKFAQYLSNADKRYRATIQLGIKTNSGDAEGEIIANRSVNIGLEQIQQAISNFSGPITQLPPMYSALKHQGKPLYEYARAGLIIERRERLITIYAIEIIQWQASLGLLTLDVHCSKGTYIRSLADDLGESLGCGGHLQALRRTAVGPWLVTDAHAWLIDESNSLNNCQNNKHNSASKIISLENDRLQNEGSALLQTPPSSLQQTLNSQSNLLSTPTTAPEINDQTQSNTSLKNINAVSLASSNSNPKPAAIEKALLPLAVVVSQLPAYQLSDVFSQRFQHGQRLAISLEQLGPPLSWANIVAALAQPAFSEQSNQLSEPIELETLIKYDRMNTVNPALHSAISLSTVEQAGADNLIPLAIYNRCYQLLGTAHYNGEILAPARLVKMG